ncbi:MAG: hypothetical protein NVV82_19255 [Sporocytophaga sp.]|nr:hypothetical protein [Sporocytophaga sp.]
MNKNQTEYTNKDILSSFNKDLFDEFPILKWVAIAVVLFIIIYCSRFLFNAIAGSIIGFKNMQNAFSK